MYTNVLYGKKPNFMLHKLNFKMHLTLGFVAESSSSSSGISKGALAGIILGTIAGSVTLSAFVALLILKMHMKKHHRTSKRRPCEYLTLPEFGGISRYICIITFVSRLLESTLKS